jgi:hypothetical protein
MLLVLPAAWTAINVGCDVGGGEGLCLSVSWVRRRERAGGERALSSVHLQDWC